MKTREHKFMLTVKGSGSKALAKAKVLSSFALRSPDCWEFRLKEYRNTTPKKAVVNGGTT